MILAIDLGNTQTCFGLFEEDKYETVCHWRSSTYKNATIDELANNFMRLFDTSEYKLHTISSIIISCVVPSLSVIYEKAVSSLIKSKALNTKVLVCNAQTAKNLKPKIYDCKYANPNEVGPDIIAACIAAKALYSVPCAVVDFGTATNINIINSSGEFIGAIISAGMKTSLDALISYAGALSEIELKVPEKIVGSSTDSLIQSGSIIGEACRADGLIDKVEEELASNNLKVICTGGWSKLLCPLMNHDVVWAPDLVLQGLKIFAENYHG